jgi:DNA-binding transcriptional LysR family regulator
MALFEQMTTFARVVDQGSLSAAARGLRLSLPAVSRQLRALETELGVTLLARSSRGLQLTEAGQRFHAESVAILSAVDRARASTKDRDAIAGHLVVSVAISIGLELALPRLSALLARHRSLQLEIRLDDRIVDLVAEGVDVAVRAGIAPPDTGDYIAHTLGDLMWRIPVAAPTYLRRRGKPTTVRQLAQHDCLVHLGPVGPNRRLSFRRGDEVVEVELHGPAESNAALALEQLAIAGHGIAVLPEWLVAADLRERRLQRVLPGWRNGPTSMYALHRVELRGSARVRAVIDALRDVRLSADGDGDGDGNGDGGVAERSGRDGPKRRTG